MSTPTQLKAAQISEDSLFSQSFDISHSYQRGPQQPFPHALLAPLDINPSITEHELYNLQLQLDCQCVQLAAAIDDHAPRHATSDVNSVIELAVKLSGPLCLARHQGTFLYQELQLRALISCLALLHYHRVQALYPEQWDKLKRTDLQRIAFQIQSDSALTERIRYAPNVYLLQLASQYLSFLRRGDSNLPFVVGPIVKIFWGGLAVAIHQYHHVPHILEGLSQLFALWQSPQTKYKALWGLQEYTRLASSICREATDAPNGGAIREAAAILVPALLEKVEGLIDDETRNGLPRLGRQWPKWRSILDLPPPELNQGYYLFGLLDCAGQLAALIELGVHRAGLMEKMRHMVCLSNVEEYRWKAIEVLLSLQVIRVEQLHSLRLVIEENCRPARTDVTLEETMAVYNHLEQDEKAQLRFRQRRAGNITLPPASVIRNDITEALGSPFRTNSTSTVAPSVFSSISNLSAECGFREPNLSMSKVKATMALSVCFSREGFLGGVLSRKNYKFAGLSADCQHAFFYNEVKIAIFRLGDLLAQSSPPSDPRVEDFGSEFTHGDPIFDVVMSPRFLVVMTTQHILLKDIVGKYQVDGITHGSWTPAGLECRQTETHLILALGQGRGNSSKSADGQIQIYKCEINNLPRKLSHCSQIELPFRDRPKRICLSENARTLICVTMIQNKVLIWNLDEDLSPSAEPFGFFKNRYRTEKYETGITSTSIYTSPTNNPYLLFTTSPSSERHLNDGEWSFTLPLPKLQPTPPTPRLQPPSSSAIHSLSQFQHHRALRAGAVSNKHNVFAVLEDNGRISLLPLAAGADGGVCGAGDDVKVLETSIEGGGGCLRFTPDGERLIAVNAKGKVVVVDFGAE